MAKHQTTTRPSFAQQMSSRLKLRLPEGEEKARKKKPKILSSYKLVKQTTSQILANKKLFLWVGFWFILLRILALGLPEVTTYQAIQEILKESIGNNLSWTGVSSLFSSVLNGAFSSATTELSQFLQIFVFVIFWLAILWITRQIMAGKNTSLREAIYNAPVALVPTVLLLGLLIVQLIPGSLGMFLLSYTTGAVESISGLLAMGLSLVSLLLIAWTIFMAVRTVIGLIIVSLPNTYPLNAFRTAKSVVKGRRFTILLKLLGLGVTLVLVAVVLLLPPVLLSAWLGGNTAWVVLAFYEFFNVISFIFAITYLYRMYRALI